MTVHPKFADPAQRDLDAARHDLVRQPAIGLNRTLKRLAENAVNRVAAKKIGSDPILGERFAMVSVGSKIQKAHGKDLPAALGLILEAHGLRVWHEPQLGLTPLAVALAEDNSIEDCERLTLKGLSGDRQFYRPDLIVHCPMTGWTLAIEGKRGGGASDSTARDESTVNIRAAYLSLPQWAREHGLQPTVCDARIVDFLGASTFKDELLLCGWHLNAYFGSPIEEVLALYSAHMRIAAGRLLGRLEGKTDSDASRLAEPVPEILAASLRVRAPDGLRQQLRQTGDLFADGMTPELDIPAPENFSRPEKSLAAARKRFMTGCTR
jgi:hypothetical protein